MLLYNDEEYSSLIKDDTATGWTRAETDYLMSLCKQLDLKWVVIADRYGIAHPCLLAAACDVDGHAYTLPFEASVSCCLDFRTITFRLRMELTSPHLSHMFLLLPSACLSSDGLQPLHASQPASGACPTFLTF